MKNRNAIRKTHAETGCVNEALLHGLKRLLKLQYRFSFFPAPNSQPRNLDVVSKTSTELELSWDAPPMIHWNSERLSYKVGYR